MLYFLVRWGFLGEIAKDLYMRADAAKAYRRMHDAAKLEGIEFFPSGPRAAYRTAEMQRSLVLQSPNLAAPVGKSMHQRGLAVDIDLVDDSTGRNRPCKAWLEKHAGEYGFAQTVAREPWHFEYIA